jgi:hypothetical protein
MRELDPKDLSWAVRLLPEEVKNLMTRYNKRIVLGGGYLRATIANEKVNDLDLFTSSALESKLYADLLAKDAGRKVYETENAYSLRLPKGSFVQFIHRWTFPNPEALIQSFDFTIACAAIWVQSSTKWTSLADDNFYSDLAAKRLVYRSPVRNEDAGGSLLRVLKYYQRGYRIPLDSLGAVLARIASGIETDLGYTTEQEVAAEFTRLLVQVDPQVDPAHEAHLPAEETDE